MKSTIQAAALAVALLLAASGGARAADAPPAGAFDWTGVYVGVNAGAAYAHERWNFSQIGTDANSNVWSGVTGGTLGWNFVQTGPWVFGVEGDYDWADLHSHTPCPNPTYNCTVNVTNLATARARAGYAVRDRWLVFATAGVAGGTVQPAAPVAAPGTAAAFFTPSKQMRWGYVVGAGVEYALCERWGGAWSAKLEYLYADLGDNQFVDNFAEIIHVHTQIQTVRAGLNFRF